MKIGIISDTHDHLDNLAVAVRLLNERGVELVLHLGDWVAPFVPVYLTKGLPEPLRCPIQGVFGNNEGDPVLFLEVAARQQTGVTVNRTVLTLERDGRRIACYHGTDPEVTESLVASERYDVVFTGHTHEAAVRRVNGVLHVNPGTVSGIQGGRPGGEASLALYDTATNTAEIVPLPVPGTP